MNRFIRNALSASLVFGLLVVMGVFAVFAESDCNEGVHTPEIGISVYSPITDMVDCEISVDIQSLLTITTKDATQIRTSNNGRVQCEDALAVHQEQIESIVGLMYEQGIDNSHDLSALLQGLQSEGYYAPIFPLGCPVNCPVIPVWVTINGVRHPGFMCLICGRIILV